MTERDDKLGPTPALDYGQPATAEGFLIRTMPGGVVVSAVPTARRVLRALRGPIAGATLTGVFVALLLYAYRNDPVPAGALLLPGLVLLIVGYRLVAQLLWVLNPVRWEVDAANLTCVARRFTGVVREQYARSLIADLRVEKVKLPNRSLKAPHVVLVGAEGAKVAIASGSRRELDALATALRGALGLPPDPAREATYPPRPRGVRSERVVTQTGAWVSLRPSVMPWPVIAVAGPVLLVAALAVEHFVIFRSPTRQWTQTEARAWAVIRVTCLTLVPLTLLCAALYRLRRTTALGIQRASLVLVETGFVRPCNVEWPLSAVVALHVSEPTRPRPSAASLSIVLKNGEIVRAMDGAARRDVEFAAASLRHAISRAASPASTPPEGTPAGVPDPESRAG